MKGKVAFITGAARGQGRTHALRLAQAGVDVALFDICAQIDSVPYEMATAEDLKSTAAEVEALGVRVLAIEGDVRDAAAVQAAVDRTIEELGKLDILISNAGIWALAPFWEMTEQAWQDQLDVNLTGSWHVAKAAAPHMIENGEGAIVFISSVNGLEPAMNYAHYTSAKHGLIGLMRSVALELGPHGIRANAITPGFIDTKINDYQESYDMMAGAGPGEGTPEDRIQAAAHWSALKGRSVIPPEAVSNAVFWLVSDESRDVTGLVMPVDAGHMLLPAFSPAPV